MPASQTFNLPYMGQEVLEQLPALRQELALYPGPVSQDGSPTWTLHDPVDHRFFQLGWAAFEILSRWSLGLASTVMKAVNQQTTLSISQEDIQEVYAFLRRHHLTTVNTAQDGTYLAQAAAASRMSYGLWLLKHYLFFRLPLVRPSAFLQRAMPCVSVLFKPAFWWVMLASAVLGLFLVAQQWDRFTHTFAEYGNWQGVISIAIAISLAKVLHELGHAFTAQRHGCRVPTMGVAFMVMVPMLYTDTNDAWKLPSRRARLLIGSAGIAAELALAACATLAWTFLPDGPVRAGAFLLATSTWIMTLGINLSPFMRFDGYFLLCDYLEIPNLHERSFALGRWQLRQWLFGLKEEVTEVLSPQRHRALIAFAYAVWLYRLVLFLGIAFLVYSLFFKVLGIFLLIVELGWFIAWPVQREMKIWWGMRSEMRWNKASLRGAALAAFLVLIIVIPWPRGVSAPAVLSADKMQWLYAPAAAQITAMSVRTGQSAQPGQVLLSMESPNLRYQLGMAQAREQQLRWQVEQQAFAEKLQERGASLAQRWNGSQEEVLGLMALSAQLQLSSSFAGTVVSLNPALHTRTWVNRGERLLQVATAQGIKLDAYVQEEALHRIEVDQAASFIADEHGINRIECRVQSIDRIATAQLEHTALASPFGGSIPAKLNNANQAQPLQAIFRVRLHDCKGLQSTNREITGVATIGRSHTSFAGQWWRSLVTLWHREGGL